MTIKEEANKIHRENCALTWYFQQRMYKDQILAQTTQISSGVGFACTLGKRVIFSSHIGTVFTS